MELLVASLAALGVGPLLHRFTTTRSPTRAGIDGFTFIAMVGLILVHVIPESVEQAGLWALLVALVGLFGPTLFEAFLKNLGNTAHRVAVFLGLLGLLLHAALDGIAIQISTPVGLAVVLHRIADGMTVWWLLTPGWGRRAAVRVIILMGLATVAGWVFAEHLEGHLEGPTAGFVEALVGGALLHVVLHRVRGSGEGAAGSRLRLAEGLGGLLGAALVYFILDSHGSGHPGHGAEEASAHAGFGAVFLDLARESAPALVGAFLLSGLIQVFLPKATAAWLRRGRPAAQALRGVVFGLPLPICSCGVIPVYRSLVAQGAPLPAALAFLVATPELGLDAVLLSMPLLGGPMAAARVGAAFVVALLVGIVVGSRYGEKPGPAIILPPEEAEGGIGRRLARAMRLSAGELFDSTSPWIVLGLVVAAMLAPVVDPEAFSGLPSILQVPLFALLGMPIYVCASGATPLVAVFLAKGVSPGAALAFLLTGPATNVTTFGLLSRQHGRAVALAFAGTIAATTMVLGIGLDAFLKPAPAAALVRGAVDHHHADDSLIGNAALAVLALMVAASVLRQGARGYVSRVFAWAADSSALPDCCRGEGEAEATAAAEPTDSCGHHH